MTMLARDLSEEMLLDRRVKQIGVEDMVSTVIDEAVFSEKLITTKTAELAFI